MAGPRTQWLSASGHRFVLRRIDRALLGRPMPRGYDRVRGQRVAAVVGCVLAAVVAGVTAVPRPAAGPGDAALLMVRESGALFVRVGRTFHPVPDLASARLILNAPDTPRVVGEAALAHTERGPLLGIPGGPHHLGTVMAPADAEWSVCDNADATTTVAVAASIGNPSPATLLVTDGGAGATSYLLHGGRRAPVDPADPVTARALRLDTVHPRRVSAALLNVLPESPPISAPPITGRGEPSAVGGFAVGTVLRVARAGSAEFYVVLRDGVQRVGRLAADLIRLADVHGAAEIATVAADVVMGARLTDTLPVGDFPDDVPAIDDGGAGVCATWVAGRTAVRIGPAAAPTGRVRLAGADGDGPAVDEVLMPPGRSLDVTAATIGGDPSPGNRYLVIDTGALFALHDSAAAAALGLTGSPAAAPWSILGVLPAGPELSREAALVSRDVGGARAPAAP